MASPSSKELSSYSDTELSEHFKEYHPRWVVPQHILVQAQAWNESHPGYAAVLPAELETKETA